MTEGSFDVVIIGGGIHGVCAAAIAAKSGLRTALVEQSDFASGTSSRSSKMAHGGLRYLEMFDIQQVFEGIKAREELFERAPHLVKPEHFLIPVPVGNYWFRAKLGIGLRIYDKMVRKPEHRHSFIPRKDLTFSQFDANHSDLMGCFQYTDGLMNDARLVIELLVYAEKHGAFALNYASVATIKDCGDAGVIVECRDELAETSDTSAEFSIQASLVINCAGPWAPFLRNESDTSPARPARYSRGSHLLFSVPWRDPSLFLPLAEKGRYYFVWPHPSGTMVGTTEREVGELEKDPQPSADEVQEILDRLSKDLPASGLTRESLHYGFAGVRTLPIRSTSGGVSKLSRKHDWHLSKRVLTLLGGKFTTFAWTASEGIKLACTFLALPVNEIPSPLENLPGAMTAQQQIELIQLLRTKHGRTGMPIERAVRRLGNQVLEYLGRNDAWESLPGGILKLEILHAIEREHAVTIEDLLRRRLDLEYLASHGLETIDGLSAALVSAGLGATVKMQVAELRARLTTLHSVLGIPSPRAV